MHEGYPSPFEKTVSGYRVKTKEFAGDDPLNQRWVGSDVVLDIYQSGRFFLNVITRQQHEAEIHLEKELVDDARPEMITTVTETRPPYIVNESELSKQVLDREFLTHPVQQGLADCLWFDGHAQE